MITKNHHYVIECTLDPNCKVWEAWSNITYKSYSAIKNEVWKLTQTEAEFNRTEEASTFTHKIFGFRIVEKYVETKTEVLTEFLI